MPSAFACAERENLTADGVMKQSTSPPSSSRARYEKCQGSSASESLAGLGSRLPELGHGDVPFIFPVVAPRLLHHLTPWKAPSISGTRRTVCRTSGGGTRRHRTPSRTQCARRRSVNNGSPSIKNSVCPVCSRRIARSALFFAPPRAVPPAPRATSCFSPVYPARGFLPSRVRRYYVLIRTLLWKCVLGSGGPSSYFATERHE